MRGRRGFTLLEVLVAVVLLGVVVAGLMQVRVLALRQAEDQRRHVTATQILRSEAELLRAGSNHEGTCLTLDASPSAEGFTCNVAVVCDLPASVCQAAPGMRGVRIVVTAPDGRRASLSLVARRHPDRWIEAQR